MNIPVLEGVIKRRILINYRVDPAVVAPLLPSPFRPKLKAGFAVAGICLIRLEHIRPKGFPTWITLSSENSAHRFAVEWTGEDQRQHEGVYVPRRDTNNRWNHLAGGRIFPGVHQFSKFEVKDQDGKISMAITPKKSATPLVRIEASETDIFPSASIFESLADSSAYFESGCIGYSSRPNSSKMDGLNLAVKNWKVTPLAVTDLLSQYYEDKSIFPQGSVEFDHALLMRDIEHEWHSEKPLDSRLAR